MTQNKGIAPHETFELHEILTFKNVCAAKTAAYANLVSDQELRTMMQRELSTSQNQIRELQGLIQQTDFATFSGVSGQMTGRSSDFS